MLVAAGLDFLGITSSLLGIAFLIGAGGFVFVLLLTYSPILRHIPILQHCLLTHHQLIRATPLHVSSTRPKSAISGMRPRMVPVVEAFLDVETTDPNQPLRNCRIKLTEFQAYSAWTDKQTKRFMTIGRWTRPIQVRPTSLGGVVDDKPPLPSMFIRKSGCTLLSLSAQSVSG